MFEPKKTIVMFVFILFIILLSGSLGLPNEVGKEILDINKSIKDTDLERETSDIGVLETDQYPDDSDSLPLEDSDSPTQESNEAAQENTLSLSYFFSAPVMEKNGEYDVPSISQLQNEMNPGMPIIPVKSAKILLPQGENLLEIEVFAQNEIVLDGKYFIKPGGWPATFDSENLSLPAEPINLTIYNSEEEKSDLL
jgi:hypothetical protein